MTPNELRTKWIAFFTERGHAALPSDSLVPENDPTLLFTGAGMNQFKAQFAGKGDLTHRRVVTIQKCFRQGDLENVGRTPRHLTFFEMMGHFSFGDYFKKEAIEWAWEFLMEVVELPREKLHVTVFEDDDEAYEVWRGLGLEPDRIRRLDAKENFWPADAPRKGPNGVCGPCSEIFYDYGEAYAVGDGGPGLNDPLDSGRYVEIWNIVFTQFDRQEDGTLVPLPQKNIDCGAGFERVLAAKEEQLSPFGTRLFRPIVDRVAVLAGTSYAWDAAGGQTPGEDPRRMRRIAEHARAACFLIGDGVKPSNEGRGYVLRRILRRAIRDGIQLGLEKPFLADLVDVVLEVMGEAHPNLVEGRKILKSVLSGEEKRFRDTYANGLKFLEHEIAALGGSTVLSGAAAFRLHDTYGFPLDLAQVILAERGLEADVAGFEVEMEAQRERARAGSKIKGDIFAGGPLTDLREQGAEETVFLGYESEAADAQVLGLIRGEALVESVAMGDEVGVVLDQTPFYAESGGQVGDAGVLEVDGVLLQVLDTQQSEGFTIHHARVKSGALHTGASVRAKIEAARRARIRRNHTATHLLHEALKRVLGADVQQEGSLVAPDRLRFDFRHPQAVTAAEQEKIEDLVNTWILANDDVTTDVLDIEAAKASGAVSLFGEKYGDVVRVLSIPSGSKEFCGGTHCVRTGDIGSFRITVETSVAAGIRRIEGVTGAGALELSRRDRSVVQTLSGIFKAAPEELVARVEGLQDELKALKKAAEKARLAEGLKAADALAEQAEEIAGLRVLLASLPGIDAKSLKGVWETLRKKGVDVAALVGEADGKAPILTAASKSAVAKGADAKALLGALTAALKGGGGGSPAMAQGQGQDRSQIDAALAAGREALRGSLAG
jgi:alanyl-tRNA synthetase